MHIVYVSKFLPEKRLGHAYKYHTLLQRHFGGKIISWKQWDQAEDADLLFVPGYNSVVYREAVKLKKPYILVLNDLTSPRKSGARIEEAWSQEKVALENAAGMVFNSEYILDFVKQRMPNIPPHEVVHLRPLKSDLDFKPLPKLKGKHLVYAGGIKTNWEQRKNPAGYRAYHQIFKAFLKAGWKVHIYTHMRDRMKHYERMGCICHGYVDEGIALYQELSQYTAGFQGYNKIGVPDSYIKYINLCLPNKLWEYLAAGIPTIGFNPGPGGKMYNKKWGLVLKDLSKKRLKNIVEHLPVITDELRYSQTIDQDVGKFKRLIKAVIK